MGIASTEIPPSNLGSTSSSAEPPRGSRPPLLSSGLWHAIGAWGVFLVCLVVAVHYLANNTVNVPFGDDWDELPWITGKFPVTWSWLWAQHNEHRVVLPRLILVAAFRLTGHDFRAGCYLVLAMLTLLAASLMILCRKVRGRTCWTDAIFPLTLLHLGHCDNLLGAFQVQFAGSALFPGLLLAAVAWKREPPRRPRELLFLAVCTLCICGCGASSLVYAPSAALWLIYAGWQNWRAGYRVPATLLCLNGAAILGIVAWYFVGLERAGHLNGTIQDAVRVTLQFLAMGIYPEPMSYWPVAGWLVPLILLPAVCLLLQVIWTQPAERLRAAGLILNLGGFVVLAAGIGWGRRGLGAMAGCQVRYATLAAASIYLTYVTVVLYARPSRRLLVQSALCLLMFLAYWPQFRIGRQWAETRAVYCREFERDVRQGIRAVILGEIYSDLNRSRFRIRNHPRADILAKYILMLREQRRGPFQPSLDDGRVRVESLGLSSISPQGMEWHPATAVGHALQLNDRLKFHLPASEYTQRMYLQLQIDSMPNMQVNLRVESEFIDGRRTLIWQQKLHKMPEPWLLSLPVDAQATALYLLFDERPCDFRIMEMSAIVGRPGTH